MFTGEYNHTLDSKGRVSLPATFRRDLVEDESLYLFADPEGAVRIYPKAAYEQWLDEMFPKRKSSDEMYNADATNGYNPRNPNDRTKRRLIASRTREVLMDSAGRISVPQDLIAKANIDRDVTVIGEIDHIELWNAETWQSYLGSAEGEFDTLFDES